MMGSFKEEKVLFDGLETVEKKINCAKCEYNSDGEGVSCYPNPCPVESWVRKSDAEQRVNEKVAELRKDAWKRLGNIRVIIRNDDEIMLKDLATFRLRFEEVFGCEKPSAGRRKNDA